MNWLNTIARRMGFVPRKKNSFAPRRFRPALEALDRRDVPAVLVPPSSISGYVYADANNDGVFESNESGIAGVTVSLSGSDVFGSAVNLTTTTNASGAYSFSQISPGVQLNPGTYTVSETTPSGYMDGIDSIGTPASGSVVNHQFVNVALGTLSAGVNAVNYNFGEVLCPAQAPAPASLSGTVYVDNNGSDMLTAGDAGLGGQTIYIWNASGFSASTTTAANGTYSFGNLTPASTAWAHSQPRATPPKTPTSAPPAAPLFSIPATTPRTSSRSV